MEDEFFDISTSLASDYIEYDGPAFDVASIIFTVLMVLVCVIYCIIGMCTSKYKGYESTASFDTDASAVINSNSCLYMSVIFFILMFGLGLNLLIRYTLDQCSYYPDVYCGGGSTNEGGVRPRIRGKNCSQSCTFLNTFGLTLICIAIFALLVLLVLHCKNRHKNEDTKKTKCGSDCCYCYC
eukprot:465016_1